MMRFVKFKLNFVTFYLMVFHLSYGDSNGGFIQKGSVSGELKNGNIPKELSKSITDTKIRSQGRNDYLKQNPFYDRNIYDYSSGFDTFFNNLKSYPQSSISYYPISIQNGEYVYPKIFDRFFPYDSNDMSRSLSSPVGFPDQESQIPFYRDAENYGQPSEFQIIKHLVPVGYSSHIVSSPREAVLPVNDVVIDPNVAQHPITILPYPNHAAIRPPVTDQRYYNADVLLKALESAVKESTNSTDTNTTTSFQDKVQLIARLMVMVPTFADEIFKCLSRSETLSKFIQMTHNGDT